MSGVWSRSFVADDVPESITMLGRRRSSTASRPSKIILGTNAKPSRRLRAWAGSRSSIRLRWFAKLARMTQHPLPITFVYAFIIFNVVTSFVGFLHLVAFPHYDTAEEHTEPLKPRTWKIVLQVNLGFVVFYGIRNLVLFILGVGAVKDRFLVFALGLDVVVWAGTVVAWSAVVGVDKWDDLNRHRLSVAGLMSTLQLNTFMLLNAVLNPLVRVHKRYENGMVPGEIIIDLIDESQLSQSHKNILKRELQDACREPDSDSCIELDLIQFFHFSNKAMSWAEKWSTEDDKKEVQELMVKLNYSRLLDMKEEWEELANNGQSTDFDSGGVEGSPVTAFLLAVKYLTTGQRFRTAVVTLLLAFRAFTQYGFYLLLGVLVNIASSIAANPNDEQARREFNMKLFLFVLDIVTNNLTDYAIAAIGSTLISNATARLQMEVSKRVLYCTTQAFNDAFHPGDLSNAFSASIGRLETLWNEMWYGAVFPIFCVASAIAFFCVADAGYALFVSVSLPLLFCTKHLVGDRAGNASEQYAASNAQNLGRFQNVVHLRKASQVYENQHYLRGRLEERITESRCDGRRNLLWGNTLGAVFSSTGNFLILVTSVTLLISLSSGKISSGEFLSLVNYVYGIIGPLENLGLMSGRVSYLSGAVFNVENILRHEPDAEGTREDGYEATHDLTEDKAEDEEQAIDLPNTTRLTLQQSLSFEHVGFRYHPSLPLVLSDVSATVPAGSYVAIFGSSGCGKSTLLSLVEGFHTATSGRICMDGKDISSVPKKELHQALGVVFQDIYILDGSIRENIAFGMESATAEAVVRAAKDAQIHNFIDTLPDKYETIIGSEANVALSGGQLQRICGLSRALLRQPSLLILDEATSALDTVSEQAVIDTVLKLRNNKSTTTLSVSHHPNTAVEADNIIVLGQGGKVDQMGTYTELIDRGGLFAEIVKAGEA